MCCSFSVKCKYSFFFYDLQLFCGSSLFSSITTLSVYCKWTQSGSENEPEPGQLVVFGHPLIRIFLCSWAHAFFVRFVPLLLETGSLSAQEVAEWWRRTEVPSLLSGVGGVEDHAQSFLWGHLLRSKLSSGDVVSLISHLTV